jgi:hypothetical protein
MESEWGFDAFLGNLAAADQSLELNLEMDSLFSDSEFSTLLQRRGIPPSDLLAKSGM